MSENKNIMILFLSDIKIDKNKVKSYPYRYTEKDKYIIDVNGIQTNEAAVKAVIHKLNSNNEILSDDNKTLLDIYMICTEKVRSNIIDNVCFKHVDFFESRINNFCKYKEGIPVPNYYRIEYDETSTGDNVFSPIIEMANMISASESENVYADMTGGMRNSSMLMLSIMRLLQYKGIKVKQVFYSNFDRDTAIKIENISNYISLNGCSPETEKVEAKKKEPNNIDDVTNIYELNNLIAGAEEFNKFGSADTLSKYFKSKNNCSDSLNDLIASMKNFSNNIKLCRADIFIKAIDDLSKNIKLFTEYFKKHFDKTNTNDRIFSLLLPMIKDTYNEILNTTNESKCKQYIEIIKWCNKRGLLQQALTLYVELVPEYLESCNEGKSLEIVSKFIHKKQPPDTAQPEHCTDKAIHKFIDHRNAKNIKREPLDFEIIKPILLSYYSIKSERNATSHANEDKLSSENNLDIIDVGIGTNEYNRISEMLSKSIKLIEENTSI